MFFTTCFGGRAPMYTHTCPRSCSSEKHGVHLGMEPSYGHANHKLQPFRVSQPLLHYSYKRFRKLGTCDTNVSYIKSKFIKRTWVGCSAMAINFNCINLVQINETRDIKRFQAQLLEGQSIYCIKCCVIFSDKIIFLKFKNLLQKIQNIK